MNKSERGQWAMLGSLLLLASGCESSEEIGSACRHGVCPQAITPSTQLCSAVETSFWITVTRLVDEQNPLASVCLPSELPRRADGTVECNVEWTIPRPPEDFALLGMPALAECDDASFLTPVPGDADVCAVRQLDQDQRDTGDDGWFYNDDNRECLRGHPSVTFSSGAVPLNGTTIAGSCLEARVRSAGADAAASGDVRIAECSSLPLRPARGIGDACTPQLVPDDGGFDQRQRTLEIGSPDCATGVCLINELDGNPAPDCVPDNDPDRGELCPTESEIERRVYCSCRCDAPQGAPECECPSGFTCEPMFQDAPDGIRGGYCIRNDT